jgi:xylulokinase
MAHYLGLDASTQSVSALVIETQSGKVALDISVNFGKDLPQYNSPNGFLLNPDPNVKHSDPLMWLDAMELVLERIQKSGFDLGQIRGVSGAGQQHGSVYLKAPISKLAAGWSPDRPLREQVRPLLSRPTSPIWMDSSTGAECAQIADAVGGSATVTRITGSRTIERFTGPQIRRFYRQEPDAYRATGEIHLVSSFMASVLAAQSAPIDYGDGAGMNLLDLESETWSERMLQATAPELGSKLPPPKPSVTPVGPLAGYFVEKYGFSPGTPVIAFSGDNPSSLIGMGASQPGTLVVSLGTSDVVCAAMSRPLTDPHGYGHVFGNPAGGFMSLICFTNGSLAREEITKKFQLSWEDFSRAILDTPTGNNGNFMLPYFVPETVPRMLKPEVRYFGNADFTSGRDPRAAARAIVEAQAVSLRHHSDWIGEAPTTLLVTGGASRNRAILQVLADVFQAEVRTLSVGNSSALGGALRAAQAVEGADWQELYAKFAAPDPDLRVAPNPASTPVYADLSVRWVKELDRLLAERS